MATSTLESAPRRDVFRLALLSSVAASLAGALPLAALAAHAVKRWPANVPAPALALTGIDEKPWDLASLKGRPVLLNFWATWCAPCRAEMPTLERLAAAQAPDGLVVLTVNYKEPPETIRRFTDALPMRLPVLRDRDGTAAAAWTPGVFPSTVLVGRDGRPRQTVIGELDWSGADARALIAPLLRATPSHGHTA